MDISHIVIHLINPVSLFKFFIYVIVRVHLSVSSRLRGLKMRAQREPVASLW